MKRKNFTVNVMVSSEKDDDVFEDFSVEIETTTGSIALKRLIWDALSESLHKLKKDKKISNFGPWCD
jgi:hypothetical protein